MYKIDKTYYGYRITFGDVLYPEEMKTWVKEFKNLLNSQVTKFQVFVDMRNLKPLSEETEILTKEGQKLAKKAGMERSVVILNSSLTRLQFIRIAKQTGIYHYERYIDAASVPDYEAIALDWLLYKKDPEKT